MFGELCPRRLFVVVPVQNGYTLRAADFVHPKGMRQSNRFRICALAITLAISWQLLRAQTENHASPKNSAEGKTIPIKKLTLQGVPNFGEVTPLLYRGAHASPEGLRNLKEMGIQIIVDLRGRKHRDEQIVEQLGMQYVHIGGTCFPQSDEKYATFLNVVDKNPDKKIFVECTLGDDRTGMAIAAFRMANQGYTPEEAMEEMRTYGFNEFHHVMCWFLARYEEHFLQTYATHPAFADDRRFHPPPQRVATSQ
jgi:tyrosine-protein phosphatase SIW14